MSAKAQGITARTTRPEDFPGITALCQRVYPQSPPWTAAALASHHAVFPTGQLVAVDPAGRVVGMAASLIVSWDDYDMHTTWRDITAGGTFTNHDPEGRTLYGAEVMVDPLHQGQGIGKLLYAARRELCRDLKLLRIRAGARLRDYHRHADQHTPEAYVREVVEGDLSDPTLTFQLKQGFKVLAVVPGYLRYDPESLGYAAVIEWLNYRIAKPKHYARRPPTFLSDRR